MVRGNVGLLTAVLFPYTRNFAPHCLSSPRCTCIKEYHQHTAGGGGGGGGPCNRLDPIQGRRSNTPTYSCSLLRKPG